jgi:ubiquinone/menaquinone biosynthesis C-methylase UbiE
MNNTYNRLIYRLMAPVYDRLFAPISASPRRRLIAGLALQPGERVLIPGVGTGQDLALLPPGVQVVAGDYSPAMLAQARHAHPEQPGLLILDAQQLPLTDASVDGVLLSLILSVVPDGAAAFREAWRVLKPGGRMGVFDKFLPTDGPLTPARALVGAVVRKLGTDPNRRWRDLTAGIPGLVETQREPSILAGQYQLIWLKKEFEVLRKFEV